MKSVAAMLLMAWCGYLQADVYQWTDERGEAHFDEHPPAAAAAKKVMTQEQIERTEQADKAIPPPSPSADGPGDDQEVQERLEECQRFKSLQADFLRTVDTSSLSRAHLLGYGVGYLMRENESDSGLMDYNRIQANIRKYCQE